MVFCRISLTGVLIFFIQSSLVCTKKSSVQDNLVVVPDILIAHVVDGRGDNACWERVL